VLRRLFWPRRDKVIGEWSKLHNEELNDLYSSPNITWVIKLRRMRGNLREMDHLEDPGADEKIILRWIFRKGNERPWTGLFWIRTVTGGRHL
jgi:hypothetical protein